MVFVHHLLSADKKWGFVYNFSGTTVDDLFDNPVLLKNVEKCFLLVSWRMIGSDLIKIK